MCMHCVLFAVDDQGRERTFEEFQSLLESAGFDSVKLHPMRTPTGLALVEARVPLNTAPAY